MAEPSNNSECPNCRRLLRQLERMEKRMADLEERLAATQAELSKTQAELTKTQAELAKARKNSGNSSKPPSSDIVKPKASGKAAKKKDSQRKRGAQPGHPKHERPPFDESQIDHFWDYTLTGCPCCGGPVELTDDEPRIVQQVELVASPIEVSEHRGRPCWCENCEKTWYAPIDEEIQRGGLAGPRLTALVGYLKGAGHCSFTTIRKFLRDVVGVTLSRGYLRKLCEKVSASLEEMYEQLLGHVPEEPVLNVDETGHKNNGQAMWTWCFRAATFTLFKIDPSRSSQVLLEVLGDEFGGVLGCDYYSAYRKYMRLNDNVLVQFCLAHLIRDIKFLVEHPEKRNRTYGKRVLKAAKDMFALFHRRDEMAKGEFARRCEDAANELCGAAKFGVPQTKEAQNLANRFWQHGESYVRFLTTPGIEPTNNLAEQAIRFVVIDRHVTQGSRSEAGQRWLERIWTVMATCQQQARSVFAYLHESITAHIQQSRPPELLPQPT